ncbi:UPF0175 family protein [Candidatus Electronema sp. JC]|uniref:UPF0175 family protein n=1 Tax=Candidatus Electronema sp. JC TaxID=3401570 RepID=UPI003B43A6AC
MITVEHFLKKRNETHQSGDLATAETKSRIYSVLDAGFAAEQSNRSTNKELNIMPQCTITIPERLQLNVRETKRFLAAKLYEAGKLSLGQAAELAGLSKRAFSEILADYNVSLINYPPADILRDAAQF